MKKPAPITRRDFVKSSATAAVGASFVLPAFARSVHVSHTDTLRVGLVGCGGRGTGAAQQALNADPNAILTAAGDVFMDRVEGAMSGLRSSERLAERIRVQRADCFEGIDNYKQVIDSGVDVVLLATPPVFRPMHLRYAVERGVHVFCEKPVAVDAPGIRSVLESARIAREKNLALVSGFCWRYHQPQREMYRRIHDGAIGDVRSVQTTYNTGPLGDVPRQPGWSDLEWQLRNWKAFNWVSGDHIVEQAVHAIDWINWAFNGRMPARAFAVGGRQCRSGEWTGNMYDHFSVIYEYEGGARAYHMCRQIANCSNDNTAHLLGTKGTCSTNPWSPSCIIEGENPWRYERPRDERGRPINPPDMYQQEHNELFASIRSGEPINDGQWMTDSTMLAILGREAAYTGQTITWEQMMASTRSYTPTDWTTPERPFPPVPMPGQTRFE